MEEIYFITILIISIAVFSSLYGIGMILWVLRYKVRQFIEQKERDFDSKQNFENDKEKIRESLKQANLIDERETKLGWITKCVAIIELIIFGGLTLLMLNENSSILETMKIFGAFLGGWLGIKVLSSHGAWSDPIVGKAYYHISLFGVLLNVTVAFSAVYLIYYFAQCSLRVL